MTTMDVFATPVPTTRSMLRAALGLVAVASIAWLLLASPSRAGLAATASDCASSDRVCQLAESATRYFDAR